MADPRIEPQFLREVAAQLMAQADALKLPAEVSAADAFAPTGFRESNDLANGLTDANYRLQQVHDGVVATVKFKAQLIARAADLFPQVDTATADQIRGTFDKLVEDTLNQPLAPTAPPVTPPPAPPR